MSAAEARALLDARATYRRALFDPKATDLVDAHRAYRAALDAYRALRAPGETVAEALALAGEDVDDEARARG